ncbi:Uncharacterised protein [Vibrio cholerae]|nr:Uncharacterised protein [Vibrio cholerae]
MWRICATISSTDMSLACIALITLKPWPSCLYSVRIPTCTECLAEIRPSFGAW